VKNNVLIFTPTYNEIGNIERWINEVISQGLPNILIVDDNSIDGTTELLTLKSREVRQIELRIRGSKSGIGSAHLLALEVAFEKGFDYLITLDADLSHNPRDIPRFIEAVKSANYVVGTRSRGGRTELAGVRLILSRGANLVCRVMLPTGLSEYTTAYRCYDRKAMEFLIKNPPKDEGYSFFIEATDLIYRSGLKIAEIPIIFLDRMQGESKIPSLQVFRSAIKIIRLSVGRIKWLILGGRKLQL
jgi:dolichol-phosphate mannosyltransferase